LEQDVKNLQVCVAEQQEQLAVQQEQVEGNANNLRASLDQITSFSSQGRLQAVSLNRQWASGSRQPLLRSIRDAALSKPASVVCVHGHHGCGKSSALSQIMTQFEEEGVLVLSHMFMFGDAASSVDVALASLCVQVWRKALDAVSSCAAFWFCSVYPDADSFSGFGHRKIRVWVLLEQRRPR
jgi:hypothetical protein